MRKWVESSLGACFDLVKTKARPETLDPGCQYIGMENILPDTPRVTGPGRVGDVRSQVGIFEADDVLFGRLRAYLRKVAFAERGGAASTEVLILRPRREVVEPRFLYLLASSPACIDYAVAMSAGSRMPRTSAADLGSFPILRPSLDEQYRIVDIMFSVDGQVEALNAELEAVRSVLRQVLVKHFTEPNGTRSSIKELCLHVVGGIWGSPEGEKETDVLALGARVYTQGTVSLVTNGSPDSLLFGKTGHLPAGAGKRHYSRAIWRIAGSARRPSCHRGRRP